MFLRLGILVSVLVLVLHVASALAGSFFVPVTGARCKFSITQLDNTNPGPQPVPLRRSITELADESGPQWHLYIQALKAMYDKNPRDRESFFAIAGIHGRPFIEWDNAGPRRGREWGGYSTHSENLFLIWHRPYLALFEQILVKEASKIANAYPEQHRAVYQQAASQLRAPYWDWASEPWLPRVALPERITIQAATATGLRNLTIDNPLFTYKFPREARTGRFGPFSTSDRMYRCPNGSPVADQKLAGRNFRALLYDTFARSTSFAEFSTTASSGGSLEAVHNAIHWDAGCGGQFLSSDYSAFEPLFMLHHANTDRLWAYWQALHPDMSTFSTVHRCRARFATPAGTWVGLDSALEPFRRPDGGWHTPRSVNSIRNFGYSYRGLEYWSKSEKELQESAIKMVNSLYGPIDATRPQSQSQSSRVSYNESSENMETTSTMPTASPTSPTSPTSPMSPTGFHTTLSSIDTTATIPRQTPIRYNNKPALSGSTSLKHFSNNGKNRRFYASIAVEVSLLPFRPCSIEVSLDKWVAGSMVVMLMPERGLLYDSIPLAGALASVGLDDGGALPDEELLARVKAKLRVKLAKPDGSGIEIDTVPGLSIKIERVEVNPPASKLELSRGFKSNAYEAVFNEPEEDSACES